MIKLFYFRSLTFSLIFLSCTKLSAQQDQYIPPKDSAVVAKLQQWQDWKFGVLIHWGPYSQWGVVESWSLCPEDEGWCQRKGPYGSIYKDYKEAYENIRHEFNPTHFNPGLWAIAARNAGMKYVVFTTKHHDGFCMFDSKYTDYKITDPQSLFSSNPRSNVVKEVFTAFRKNGISIGAYFSKPDWHSTDYWWPYFPPTDRNVNYDPKKYPERWKSFQNFTYNQVEELMKNYGAIDLLWLDGGWVRPAESLTDESRPWLGAKQYVQDVNIPRIAAMARKNQPGLLIVDRSVHNEYENYRTPEQQVPDSVVNYPWESCITLGSNWYSTGDPAEKYKTVKEVVRLLINIVAKGGNLLLGVGPDKTGDLVPEVYSRLEEIGKWTKINGEGIYGTIPCFPYKNGPWCFTKSKSGKTVYAFLVPTTNETLTEKILFPKDLYLVKPAVYLLGYPKPLAVSVTGEGMWISVPKNVVRQFLTQPAWGFRIDKK